MRKIFTEDLPLNRNGTVSWKNSVGCNVRFIYDNINGIIQILDYNNKNYHITVKYNERIRDIFVGSFKECMINELIGLRHSEYKYDVGDIVFDSFIVLEQTMIKHAKIRSKNTKSRSGMNKAYILKCLNCQYIFTIGEDVLDNKKKKDNCPICGIGVDIVIKGLNDLWTTDPELATWLLNPEDGYTNKLNSNKKLNWKCPCCGEKIKNKSPSYINKRGISCLKCKDGISYPERILRCILIEYNIKFKMHVRFNWSNNKEYDFYLTDYNYIIETHGEQHYRQSFIGKRDLYEEELNDIYKKDLAEKNNISNYIVIDCRKSDCEFIINNIINSKLSDIVDLSNINVFDIDKKCVSNLLKMTCDLWDNGINDIKYISDEIKLSEYTIMDYLKRGTKLGICNYCGTLTKKNLSKTTRSRKVRCITTNKCFNTLSEARDYYNISNSSNIISCCNGKYSYCGKLDNGTKLQWEYID